MANSIYHTAFIFRENAAFTAAAAAAAGGFSGFV